jgi:hypothetical protein
MDSYVSDSNYKQLIHKIWDGTEVFLVHGHWVRDNINNEFIGGGHNYQDDYIPENEIWVEKLEDPADTKEVLVHELTEYIFMKYGDLEYDDAHEIANTVEDTVRRIPDYKGEPTPKTTYQEGEQEGMRAANINKEEYRKWIQDKISKTNDLPKTAAMPTHPWFGIDLRLLVTINYLSLQTAVDTYIPVEGEISISPEMLENYINLAYTDLMKDIGSSIEFALDQATNTATIELAKPFEGPIGQQEAQVKEIMKNYYMEQYAIRVEDMKYLQEESQD